MQLERVLYHCSLSGADRALGDADLRSNFAGLERTTLMRSEKSEYLIWDRKFLKFVLTRVFEGFPINRHR